MARSRVALSALLVPVVCCFAPAPGLDPEATLSRYLNATKADRWSVAYGDLSAKDRAYQSFEDYRSARADSPLAPFRSRTEFEIKESTLGGDRATVIVAVTQVDVEGLAGELADRPPDEAAKAMETRGEEGDLPMATRDEAFVLVKEDGLWKVFLGLEAAALVAEGRRLQEDGDFAAAKTRFEAALRSNAESAEASAGLTDTEGALAKRREQEAYFSSIEIRNVRIQRGESPAGDLVVHLRAEVRNAGKRTLGRLEVRATCVDDGGEGVYEQEHLALDVPTGQADDQNPPVESEPLKPNSTQEFLMDLESEPCRSSDVKVGVVALDFVP